jgi:hypothetical protein
MAETLLLAWSTSARMGRLIAGRTVPALALPEAGGGT